MKWNRQDLEQYGSSKEYVDTAIVPLLPFQLSNDANLEHDAFQCDVISTLIRDLERELTGRLLLLPNYTYLASADKEVEMDRVNTWVRDICSQPFNFVFFITFDAEWKTMEHSLDGTLLWFPAAADSTMKSAEISSVIRSQAREVIKLIRSYWKQV